MTHTYVRAYTIKLRSKERWLGGCCVRLSTRSAVKIQRENVAGGNDEEAAEFSCPFDGEAHPN